MQLVAANFALHPGEPDGGGIERTPLDGQPIREEEG
jgi:hypothetical protein